MARKTKVFQIQASGNNNRDAGKTFLLTELPASRAERWAMRALQALLRANVEMPDDLATAGLAGIARMGMKALGQVDEFTFVSLMDEMMGCVSIMPDPRRPEIVRPIVDGDVEEISTLIKLRMEVFELHTGFSIAGSPSTATASLAATTDPASSTMQTSPAQLAG